MLASTSMDLSRPRTPVFIVGAPRSGTTLLRVILNRHSQLAMWGGESAFFRRLYDRRQAFGDPGNPDARARIVDAYLAINPVLRLRLDLARLRAVMLRDGDSWPALFGAMLAGCASQFEKPYAGEKTPAHALSVTTLCEWFPTCTIIHIVRDPRAAVCSLSQMPFGTRSVLHGAHTWNTFTTAAAHIAARPNYFLLRYEDLISDTPGQLRRICGHIGLEFEESMLLARPEEGDPRPPIRRAFESLTGARLNVWQSELRPWQIAVIESLTGPAMAMYGYSPCSAPPSRLVIAGAMLEAGVETGFQKLFRLPCAAFRYLQPTNLDAEERWIVWASAMYARWRLHDPSLVPRIG